MVSASSCFILLISNLPLSDGRLELSTLTKASQKNLRAKWRPRHFAISTGCRGHPCPRRCGTHGGFCIKSIRRLARARVLVLWRRRLHEAQQHPHLRDALAVRFVQGRLEPHLLGLGALTQRDDTPVHAIG